MFELDEIEKIRRAPENYRLLRRVPWTLSGLEFPMLLGEPAGDEVSVVWLDTETTGFNPDQDKIIELGMVRGRLSPSKGRVTAVTAMTSMYEDPGFDIPEVITEITGISNEMVRGKFIDNVDVLAWFDDDPIVIAHNAGFDRGFFDKRFPVNDLRWACSIKDIPWGDFGFESTKLEYLLLKLGYFYEGHRASIDALATAFLMHCVPRATRMLVDNERQIRVKIEAFGCPFDCKDSLKSRAYRWDPDKRVWHSGIDEGALAEELAYLSSLYPRGGDRARLTRLGSRERYRPE